ncbi:MAG: S-methyl-5'-thioinosine phosphorylase, partial [Gammaproteobacteria bacterium]|nr:S-methyl-5'-thioinosine phosphorylase [Gammaproteobacteria bacterium]
MTRLAIIGGTGLTALEGLEITGREVVQTPWGEPSGPITHGNLSGVELSFLARHGYQHTIPPHQVNYRANIWALKRVGVERIIAVAAVGGINPRLETGGLAIPDQIIDYTWGRGYTFFEGEDLQQVTHIDFTEPYDTELRRMLVDSARELGLNAFEGGTYATTQGPRLET